MLVDTPLAFQSGDVFLTASHETLEKPALPVQTPFLFALDCHHQKAAYCEPTALDIGMTAPWSQPAWSADSRSVALVTAPGRNVAGDTSRIVILDGQRGVLLAQSAWIDRKIILTSHWSAPDAGAALARLTSSTLTTGDDEPVSAIVVGGASPELPVDPESAFQLLGGGLEPVGGVEIGVSTTRRGDVNLSVYPAHRSVQWAVGADGRGPVWLTRLDNDRRTEIWRLSRQGSDLQQRFETEGRVVFGVNPGISPELFHDDVRAWALSATAEPIVSAINSAMVDNQGWRLAQVSLSQSLQSGVILLVRGSSGRRLLWVGSNGEADDLSAPCPARRNHADILIDRYRLQTNQGLISVRRYRGWDESVAMRAAIIQFPSHPLMPVGFSRPRWTGRGATPDIIAAEFPTFAEWDGQAGRDDTWRELAVLCDQLVADVRVRFAGEYDAVGVAGTGFGGLLASTALFEGGCKADFVLARGPAIALPQPGQLYFRERRPGVGDHPLETWLASNGPLLPDATGRRVPAFISAQWPNGLYDPLAVTDLVAAIGEGNPEAYWWFWNPVHTAPSEFAPYEGRHAPFEPMDAQRALARTAMQAQASDMR